MHKLSHFDTEKKFFTIDTVRLLWACFHGQKELKQKFYFDHDTTFCNPLTGLFLGTRSPNSKTSHVVMKRRTKKENDCKQNLLRHIVFTAGEMFVRTLGIRGGGAGDAIPLFICFVLVLVAIKALARLSFPHKNQRKISNLRRQYFINGLLARRTALLLFLKIMFGKQKAFFHRFTTYFYRFAAIQSVSTMARVKQRTFVLGTFSRAINVYSSRLKENLKVVRCFKIIFMTSQDPTL